VKPLATGLTLAAALILSAAAAAAPEQPAMTAGDLAQLCSGTDHVSVNACRIYMLGVTQGIAVGMRIAGSGKASRPCVPPGIAAEDLEAALKSRLAALDSAGQQRDAAGFIGAALAAKFPCGADKS
jgi:hypothetical protein